MVLVRSVSLRLRCSWHLFLLRELLKTKNPLGLVAEMSATVVWAMVSM